MDFSSGGKRLSGFLKRWLLAEWIIREVIIRKVEMIRRAFFFYMETGDSSKCDPGPETLCFQAHHVIC